MNHEHYLVVLVASAGGLQAISTILSNLPQDFPAPIVIVQHLHPQYPNRLIDILKRRTRLTVKEAAQGDVLCPGVVYVAPPDKHLLVNSDKTVSLSQTEKVCHVRPAGDVLFQSAAQTFQQRVMAIVLTGMDSDGAIGVKAVKHWGGITIAQDKETSKFFSMPQSAIQTGCIDYILPLEKIAPTLIQLIYK